MASGKLPHSSHFSAFSDELNERRRNMVVKAFNCLDTNGSGTITYEDICNIYDVSCNPDFLESRLTKQQILENFLNQFDGTRGNNDGKVTFDEFCDYYTDVSLSIPSDEYFVRMMESTWQTPENDNDPYAKKNVDFLCKEVRSRLLALTQGGNEKLLQKVFNDFDLNSSGQLTIDEVTGMIAKLQVSVERKYVRPFFKVVDRNNNGSIEFEEFAAFTNC